LATVLQIAGAALVTIGVSVIFLPAGLIVGGIATLLFGLAMEQASAK
jgi:hypothetical protein